MSVNNNESVRRRVLGIFPLLVSSKAHCACSEYENSQFSICCSSGIAAVCVSLPESYHSWGTSRRNKRLPFQSSPAVSRTLQQIGPDEQAASEGGGFVNDPNITMQGTNLHKAQTCSNRRSRKLI